MSRHVIRDDGDGVVQITREKCKRFVTAPRGWFAVCCAIDTATCAATLWREPIAAFGEKWTSEKYRVPGEPCEGWSPWRRQHWTPMVVEAEELDLCFADDDHTLAILGPEDVEEEVLARPQAQDRLRVLRRLAEEKRAVVQA